MLDGQRDRNEVLSLQWPGISRLLGNGNGPADRFRLGTTFILYYLKLWAKSELHELLQVWPLHLILQKLGGIVSGISATDIVRIEGSLNAQSTTRCAQVFPLLVLWGARSFILLQKRTEYVCTDTLVVVLVGLELGSCPSASAGERVV